MPKNKKIINWILEHKIMDDMEGDITKLSYRNGFNQALKDLADELNRNWNVWGRDFYA